MTRLNPHIHFNGNAEEAFEFYRSIFGGSFSRLIRYKDLTTLADHFSSNELEKIFHISLTIGSDSVLMGSDVPSYLGKVSENEHRSKVVVGAPSQAHADKIFLELSKGGSVECPIGLSPWNSYFGALRDQYGVEWIIEFIFTNEQF